MSPRKSGENDRTWAEPAAETPGPPEPRAHDQDDVSHRHPLLELLPFPLENLELPVTEAAFVDTVGPMLEHCRDLLFRHGPRR
jgi:hypothetical protein